MKILIMSLLRLGDIVLATPVLRGLRERYPNAELHLLINGQFRQISNLVPYVDRIHEFDRERIQKGLGDAGVSLFESKERVEALVDQLDDEKFDLAVNLTHSRLSGWMMSLIQAREKIGLCFDAEGKASFGSNWFRFLNNQVDFEGQEVFHFTDVFRFALGIGHDGLTRPSLTETEAGKEEARAVVNDLIPSGSASRLIAIQALTSDVKKDWGIPNYVRAVIELSRSGDDSAFVILGAPSERERLESLEKELIESGVKAKLAIVSFEGAFSLLRTCKLLITGDTSVMHLAAAARTPILEISLGSSDYHRTGAYLHGSVIVQSKEGCAPCVHSLPCHRDRHACATRIPSEAIAMIAREILENRVFQLKTLAEEFSSEIDILRVETKASGFWAACKVDEPFSEESIGRWIDLTSRKLWLEAAPDLKMGSEVRRLADFLRGLHPEVSEFQWRQMAEDFERQTLSVETRVNGFKIHLAYLRGCYEDARRMREYVKDLIGLRERIRHSAILRSFKTSLDHVIDDEMSAPFTRLRRFDDSLSEIDRRTNIHLRLLRGLSNELGCEKGIEIQ